MTNRWKQEKGPRQPLKKVDLNGYVRLVLETLREKVPVDMLLVTKGAL